MDINMSKPRITNTIVLPDSLIEAFRELLSKSDHRQWEQGDFICEVLDEFRVLEPDNEQGKRDLRASVIRQLADRTGADRATLRDRHIMAKFYPPRIRSEWSPPLTYHQLRACKSAGPDHWREYATWACDNLPAPVAVIRAHIKSAGDDTPPWVYRWERVNELCSQLATDPECNPGVRNIASMVVRQAGKVKPT